VAAFYATEKHDRADGAIFAVDHAALDKKMASVHLSADDLLPSHERGYKKVSKKNDAYAAIVVPEQINPRLAAQQGCFLLRGRISKQSDPDELSAKEVVISWECKREAQKVLKEELDICKDTLFPDLDAIAKESSKCAVAGRADG
jgi:hypothetical protein